MRTNGLATSLTAPQLSSYPQRQYILPTAHSYGWIRNVKMLILSRDTKALRRSKLQLYSLFSLRPGWGVGGQSHVPIALPSRKISGFRYM